MRGFVEARGRSKWRIWVSAGSALLALALALVAARHFAAVGWPLGGADVSLVAGAGLLFVLAYGFKAFGWHRLFAPHERPRALALAAAGGAASVTGAALPGRFDDVVRIAVVRRYPGCRSGVRSLCFSLFLLGLIDAAALAPLASAAAAISDSSVAVRATLAVVAFGGLGASVLVLVLPRLACDQRVVRFPLARWVGERATPRREASWAWLLVSLSWLVRALGLLLLLSALGVSLSFPLAIAFLCGAAAAGALPVAPAGAATQAGAGAAILIGSGVGTSQAIAFAAASQALLIFAGAAVVLFALAWAAFSHLTGRLAAA